MYTCKKRVPSEESNEEWASKNTLEIIDYFDRDGQDPYSVEFSLAENTLYGSLVEGTSNFRIAINNLKYTLNILRKPVL